MSLLPQSAAAKAYNFRIAVAMTIYAVFLYIATRRLKAPLPSHAAAVSLSILPSIPIVAVIVIVGLYLREENDEFQRALLIETLLWGMGGTLAVTSVWGFLENFQQVPHFPAFYVFVLFWAFAGVTSCIQKLRYRTPAED